ncbi:MAG: amino acid ABC transporter ATP-binding protein, partial [Campylobacter sp.]|nr:amino acid ABC transporter ATP-binding protein [Campylobacter sp.]
MIEVKNLSKNYGENEVLKDINFSVKKGEIFALVGHSGAGKSTLLRCING